MMDIKAGDIRIREKDAQARIALRNTRGNIDYIAINAKDCWQTTWASWGKKADKALLEFDGKFYEITVAEVDHAA